LYPPLLAILFRPFALLPYYAFALTWEIVVVGTFLMTIRQLGAGFRTYVAIGILGIPIGWAIGVGQAHVPMTLLLAIGQPCALAADIKIFPALLALWCIGRRDYQSFIAFLGYSLLFGLFQLVLEPTGTLAFLNGGVGLGQLGEGTVRNLSPYVWASPIAWS